MPSASHADFLLPRGFARIRYGILALAAAILVITSGGVVVGTLEERSDRIHDAQVEALGLSRAVERHAARIVNRTRLHLVELRETIESAGGPEAMGTNRLEDFLRGLPVDASARRNVLIAGADGRTLAYAGGETSLSSIAERPFFVQHVADPARPPVISAPFRSRLDGHWRVPVSARIDRGDGSFDGIIVTTLDLEYLTDYFESLGVPHQGAVALISQEGEFLARYPGTAGKVDLARASELAAMLQGAEGSMAGLSQADGMERIGAYRRVEKNPFYVVVSFSRDSLLGPWKRNALLRSLGGAAVLGVTVLFTFLLLRRVQAERTAALNLANFRRAVDLSGDLIYWVGSDGRIVYANDTAAARLGLDPRRLPPQLHIREVSGTYTTQRWDELREVLLRVGEVSYMSEHIDRDGGRYPVHVAATHVKIDREDFAFFITRDLSEQVRQENEIRALNASLEQRVRERTAELALINAELESFSHSVSHDLRAPLNHLTGYAAALMENDGSDPEQARFLAGKLVERAGYMKQLIDELLELSRVARAPLALRDVDLSAIAAEIDAGYRKLEPGRAVRTFIEPGMRCQADPVLLRTLLENLIGNAWKYSSRRVAAVIEIFTEPCEGGRAFVVRDNGAGFDPAHAQRLFGAFQRLHSQDEFKGTGVGLATAKRIVTRHGGRIWAESSPDAGATFRFTL